LSLVVAEPDTMWEEAEEPEGYSLNHQLFRLEVTRLRLVVAAVQGNLVPHKEVMVATQQPLVLLP
jgi:hypothetical protein